MANLLPCRKMYQFSEIALIRNLYSKRVDFSIRLVSNRQCIPDDLTESPDVHNERDVTRRSGLTGLRRCVVRFFAGSGSTSRTRA